MNLRKIERIATALAIIIAALLIVGLLASTIDDLLKWNLIPGKSISKPITEFLGMSFLILLALSIILNISILTRYVREFVQAYLDKRS